MPIRKKRPACVTRIGDDLQSISIDFCVDEEWIKYVTQWSDVFGRTYQCGYWAFGVAHDDKLGWLVYEHGGERCRCTDVPEDILAKWRAGEKLPRYWHRFDRKLALKAQAEAIKLRGAEWNGDGKADGPFCDCIIQRALFGEEKYG